MSISLEWASPPSVDCCPPPPCWRPWRRPRRSRRRPRRSRRPQDRATRCRTPSPCGQRRPTTPARCRRAASWCSRCGSAGAIRPASTGRWPACTTRPARAITTGSPRTTSAPASHPLKSQVQAVSRWLTGQGFSIVEVPQNRLFVTAQGSTAQVEQAFQVNEKPLPGGRLGGARARPGADHPQFAGAPGAGRHRPGRRARAWPAPSTRPGAAATGRAPRWGRARAGGATSSPARFPNPLQPGQPLPWLVCGYSRRRRLGLRRSTACTSMASTGRARRSPSPARSSRPPSARTWITSPAASACPVCTATTTGRWPRPALQRHPSATRPRPRAGTSSRRWTWSGRMPWRRQHGIVYVGAANDASRPRPGDRPTRSTNTWPTSSPTPGAARVAGPRGARSPPLTGSSSRPRPQGIGVYFASGDFGDNQSRGRKSSRAASPTSAHG